MHRVCPIYVLKAPDPVRSGALSARGRENAMESPVQVPVDDLLLGRRPVVTARARNEQGTDGDGSD